MLLFYLYTKNVSTTYLNTCSIIKLYNKYLVLIYVKSTNQTNVYWFIIYAGIIFLTFTLTVQHLIHTPQHIQPNPQILQDPLVRQLILLIPIPLELPLIQQIPLQLKRQRKKIFIMINKKSHHNSLLIYYFQPNDIKKWSMRSR